MPATTGYSARLGQVDHARLRREIGSTGFASVPNPFGAEILAEIVAEARTNYGGAQDVWGDETLHYRSRLASLGPAAEALLNSRMMRTFLRDVFGRDFVLNPNSSCYTYYGSGDYLSPHKDGSGDCDVTVLIYVDSNDALQDNPSEGMFLEVYEERDGRPGPCLKTIRTGKGVIIVGKGADFWHGRKPLAEHERMAMVTSCFVIDKPA